MNILKRKKEDRKIFLNSDLKISTNFISPIHKHGYSEIHVVEEGEVHISMGRKEYRLSRNQAILIPADTFHTVWAADTQLRHFAFFTECHCEEAVQKSFVPGFFTELFTTAINGAYSVIGIVTIIFGVLEWKKVKISLKPEDKWNVGDLSKNATNVKSWTPTALPPIPDKRAVISRGDSIFSIIFITVFSALLLMVPQLFGAFHYEDGKLISSVCVFNLDAWDRIVPLLIFSLFIGLVDEIVHLVTGYYCKAVMYSSIICNSIQIASSIVLLKLLPFWNPYFADKMLEYMEKTEFAKGDILRYWGSDTFNNYILAGVCVISCIEIGVSVYKTLRYAK